MKNELPCMTWLGEQNKEDLLLQIEGLHHATGLSYDDLIHKVSYYKDTYHLYADTDISSEMFASSNQEPVFFCDNDLSLSVSDFEMTPCSLCPYSDYFKNARMDKERQLLYSLFDGTISVGSFKPDKVSNIFVSQQCIDDDTHVGKWPIVPLYSMLYHSFQFAYITSGFGSSGSSISIKDAEKLFFESGNYSQFMPLFANACKRDIADIERAFSGKIEQFVNGYSHITAKAALVLLSELEVSYKRCCSAYRKDHGIVRLQIRKRNLQKQMSKVSTCSEIFGNKEKVSKKEVAKNGNDSSQQTLFSTELLDAMSSSLQVEKEQLFTNEILSPGKKNPPSNLKTDAVLYSDSPQESSQTPAEYINDSLEKCADSNKKHLENSDETEKKSIDISGSFSTESVPQKVDFCHGYILKEYEMSHKNFTVLTPFTVPGFEVLIHKESCCCTEIVYWNDMISFLTYFSTDKKYYLIPTSFITGGLQYLLKNMDYIYTFHAPLLIYFLQYFSLKHQCAIVDIPLVFDIVYPNSDFMQYFSQNFHVPTDALKDISCLLEHGLSFMMNLIVFNQTMPPAQNDFNFFENLSVLEELMVFASLTFYDNEGQPCSLLQKDGRFSCFLKDYEAEGYSITSGFTVRLWADNSFQNPAGSTDNPAMKDTASKDDVTSQQASCDSFIALKNLMSWSDRLFFYIQGLRMLCRQNIFSAYDGHLLKLDEQGVLFHFECENTDTITDVLWNAFSTVYYKSYQEKLLLHLTVNTDFPAS